MTKLQKNKKGFTLTELAIVIAVIAILVAVLVPTFTSLIKKAEESSDKQLVKNLNTILTTDESISGNVESMSDAVAVAESNGYNVANLSPTSSGYDILWDQVNNRFFLVNEDNQVVYADSATGLSEGETVTAAYTYWRIIESESDYEKYSAEDYSLYITTDLDVETVVSNGGVEYAEGVTSKATTVTAKTGSATTSTSSTEGKALASTAIKTASDNTSLPLVIVKTNGGSLTVEVTGAATVKHNGTADELNLNSGNYLRNATITNSSINWNSTDVSYEETEEITTSEGTSYVGFVFADTILLEQITQIVTENITVSSSTVVTIGSNGDALAEASNEAIASLSVSISFTIEVVTTTISTDFAGGLGTENNPYQIATAEQFVKIGNYSNDMVETPYYFELTDDIDLSKLDISGNYISFYFNGVLEGNNKTITCKSGLQWLFAYVFEETQFNNFTVAWSDNNITRVFFNEALYATSYDSTNQVYITDTEIISVSYNNINFEGVTGTIYDVGGNNSALYYTDNNSLIYMVLKNGESYKIDTTNPWIENTAVTGRTQTKKTPTSMVKHVQTMIDCDVNANLTCTGYSAVFSAGQSFSTETIIQNCSYTGTFQGTKPGLLFANSWGYDTSKIFNNTDDNSYGKWGAVTVESVVLNGNIIASSSGGNVYFGTGTATLSGITTGANKYTLISTDSTLTLTVSNSQYVITKASTSCDSYNIQLHLGKVYWYDYTYTSSYGENSDMLLTINVATGNISNTAVYKATAISLKTAIANGIVSSSYKCTSTSVEGRSYSFVQYNDTWYLIVDLTTSYGLFAEEKECTAYVYGVSESLPVCQSVKEG